MKTRYAPTAMMLIAAIREITADQGGPCTWASLNGLIFIYNKAGDPIGRIYHQEDPNA